MKPFLTLCAAAASLALPCLAQNETAPDAPRQLAFNFSASYSSKDKVTIVEIGYQRIFSPANSAQFDKTIVGEGGFLTSETLSFLDAKGQTIGTLSSSFNAQGQLQSQQLSAPNQAPRALSWFKTSAKSPDITLPGSIMRANYTLSGGRLSARLLRLQMPQGPRELVSSFDAQGRRVRDTSSISNTPTDIRFFYDASGLTRFFSPAAGAEKAKEGVLHRDANGRLSEVLMKEENVLSQRLLLLPGSKEGDGIIRMESYEEGKLSSVVNMNAETHFTTQEEYEEGVLSERKTILVKPSGENQLRSVETFESGRKQRLTEYDDKGAIIKQTTYNADGSVQTTQTFAAPNAATMQSAPAPAGETPPAP